MSMCFLPKRRASIDQAPGPIIARLAASVAKIAAIQRSPVREKMVQTSIMVASALTTGVHKPIARSIPAVVSIKGRTNVATLPILLRTGDTIVKESGADQQQLDQKTDPWPPIGKSRKQPLHERLPYRKGEPFATDRKRPKEG